MFFSRDGIPKEKVKKEEAEEMINITGPACNEMYHTCAELCANATGWCKCQSPAPLIAVCHMGYSILPVVAVVIAVAGAAMLFYSFWPFWPEKKKRRRLR